MFFKSFLIFVLGLRVMKKNSQQPTKGDPTMNLRVMRSQDPTIGIRVMRNDPLMNLRVMRAATQINNGQQNNPRFLRNDNNMSMRIMLKNDRDRDWIMRMRRSIDQLPSGTSGAKKEGS